MNLPAGLTHTNNNRAWAEINDLFGDGTDYAFAMYENQSEAADLMDIEDGNEDLEDGEEQLTTRKPAKEVRLKDVYEPAVIAQRMLTEEDEIIRMTDIPERYQVIHYNLRDVYHPPTHLG